MRLPWLALFPAFASLAIGQALTSPAFGQTALPVPGFHHIHLNSTDPEGAIAFYVRQFPSSVRTRFEGLPAVKSGNIYLLFNKVSTPPATQPPTALWHFGWQVTGIHQKLALFQVNPEVHLLPLYVKEENGAVVKAEIAEANGAGFAFLQGPDGAIIEYQGDLPVERINHLHLFQKDPYCAEIWYQQHLNAPAKPRYTEANCKALKPQPSWPAFDPGGMLRQAAGVSFDDISVTWHVQQSEADLAPSRGHLLDHFALSVSDLDAWMAKLRREGVRFLTPPYKLGSLRAVMIEGPGREVIELVETPR